MHFVRFYGMNIRYALRTNGKKSYVLIGITNFFKKLLWVIARIILKKGENTLINLDFIIAKNQEIYKKYLFFIPNQHI